jgi:hypothetical protein
MKEVASSKERETLSAALASRIRWYVLRMVVPGKRKMRIAGERADEMLFKNEITGGYEGTAKIM